jgi:hypothetical protein
MGSHPVSDVGRQERDTILRSEAGSFHGSQYWAYGSTHPNDDSRSISRPVSRLVFSVLFHARRCS